MALLRMFWKLFCRKACCVSDGLWHLPAHVWILRGVQLPVCSARQWDRILAVLTALDVSPCLGNIGLAWWNGSPGSSRKLPLPLPRQEIENNPVLFLCLWEWACSWPFQANRVSTGSSCRTLVKCEAPLDLQPLLRQLDEDKDPYLAGLLWEPNVSNESLL